MPAVTPADGADDVHFTEHPVLNLHAGIALQDGIRWRQTAWHQTSRRNADIRRAFPRPFSHSRWRSVAAQYSRARSEWQRRRLPSSAKRWVPFLSFSSMSAARSDWAIRSPRSAPRRHCAARFGVIPEAGCFNITAGNLRNIQHGICIFRVKGERFSVKINYAPTTSPPIKVMICLIVITINRPPLPATAPAALTG